MLDHIYVVVGNGISDIGKGWLTGTIASLLPHALPVKIDPMLNQQFPEKLGVKVEGQIVSEDLETYRTLGLPVFADCNMIGGHLLRAFLQQSEKVLGHGFDRGSVKKQTFADVSNFVADKLLALTHRIDGCRSLVIEVGGIITDPEMAYLPAAIRALGLKTRVVPELIVLGYLEPPETRTGSPARTQNVRHAIRATRRQYTLPVKYCFIRRRFVPDSVTEAEIQDEILNIAFEVQMSPDRFIYLPNVETVHDLRSTVQAMGLFEEDGAVGLVSACLLGVPCRYDGVPDELDRKVMNLLREQAVVAVCPELLAGLPIPRGPYEIVGGDGFDVLAGEAKVMTPDGEDVTGAFITGAERALAIAQARGVKEAVLYHKSPSCGCLRIFDGSFQHRLRPGYGVFAAMLAQHGIRCMPNTAW